MGSVALLLALPACLSRLLHSHSCQLHSWQVLGNAKGVVAAVISVAIFRNRVTAVGSVGYCITVGGVVAYSQVSISTSGLAHWCSLSGSSCPLVQSL